MRNTALFCLAGAAALAGAAPSNIKRSWDGKPCWGPEHHYWGPKHPWHSGDQPSDSLPPVDAAGMEEAITESALSTKAMELQDIAYSTPNRTRVISSPGYNLTIEWITSYFDEMSDYYSYQVQPFIALYSEGNATLEVDGENIESAQIFEYSSGGVVEADFVLVDNLGCEASDYPDEVADQIALISRGECEFGLKSALAGAAGALAAVIFNDEPGPIGSGTLGEPPRPEGPYPPTVGM